MNLTRTVILQPCLLMAALTGCFQAQADVILTSEDRYVEGGYWISGQYGEQEWYGYYTPGGYLFDAQYVGDGVIGPDPYLGIPNGVEGAGDASQYTDTTVSNNRFYGNGSAFGIVIDTYNQLDMYDEGHGISSFNIGFDLLTPHAYSLTGSLSASGTGSATVRSILDFNGTSFSVSDSPFSLSGVLDAGSYYLLAEARAFAGPNERADAAYDFDLTLTHVPVPAAIWLFGSGLLGLIGLTRRTQA